MCVHANGGSSDMESQQVLFFFFQAEDGIRDAQESRGLGDVYKRQEHITGRENDKASRIGMPNPSSSDGNTYNDAFLYLSLIHI